MAKAMIYTLALLCTAALAQGRELKGIRIVKNETSPIFRSASSGGVIIGAKGVAVANAKEIIPVKNIDKHTGETKTTFVAAQGSAFAAGVIPTATVSIATVQRPNGALNTTVRTAATALFDKPKVSGVEASIEQAQVATGFFVDPKLKVIAESEAAVSAAQLEKKAPSGVRISASIVDIVNQNATAAQNTAVSNFATTLHNPIPHAKQNQTSFGRVTAIAKNGTIVFQDSTFNP